MAPVTNFSLLQRALIASVFTSTSVVAVFRRGDPIANRRDSSNKTSLATVARSAVPGDDTSLASFRDPAAAAVFAHAHSRGDEWGPAAPKGEAELSRAAYMERYQEARNVERLMESKSEAKFKSKHKGRLGNDVDHQQQHQHKKSRQAEKRDKQGQDDTGHEIAEHFDDAPPRETSNGPSKQGFELVYLEKEKYPNAVCNDGTPGAFFIQRGSPYQWVVYMQGGRWCYDEHSCDERWSHYSQSRTSFLRRGEIASLMSTANLTKLTSMHDTFNGELNNGLLSHNETENPDLHSATKVFVVYCSSDAFAGNVSRGVTNKRFHFRGKEILRSVVSTLAEKWELDKADVFLLTGSSAGGMATIANADFVSGLVRRVSQNPRPVRFIAAPDSGFFLDVNPAPPREASDKLKRTQFFDLQGKGGGFPSFADQVQKMIVFTGGMPDETCSAFYVKQHQRWRCYLGQYASKFFDDTVLFVQSQLDSMQLQFDGFVDFKKQGSNDEANAKRFRSSAIQELTQATKNNPYVHVFAPACFHHVLTTSKTFWDVKIGDKSARDVLGTLLTGAPAPRLLIDDCDGTACNAGCRPAR